MICARCKRPIEGEPIEATGMVSPTGEIDDLVEVAVHLCVPCGRRLLPAPASYSIGFVKSG